MVVEALVMAGALALMCLLTLPGHLPDPNHGSDRGAGRILRDVLAVIVFALIGAFGFAVLANA